MRCQAGPPSSTTSTIHAPVTPPPAPPAHPHRLVAPPLARPARVDQHRLVAPRAAACPRARCRGCQAGPVCVGDAALFSVHKPLHGGYVHPPPLLLQRPQQRRRHGHCGRRTGEGGRVGREAGELDGSCAGSCHTRTRCQHSEAAARSLLPHSLRLPSRRSMQMPPFPPLPRHPPAMGRWPRRCSGTYGCTVRPQDRGRGGGGTRSWQISSRSAPPRTLRRTRAFKRSG